ncbi:diguanylate cyclase [Oscillibacter sp.]|uniref:diguanylate cyclase domain-containing protein n=1 Tax=Oscillibacter sp. TaxID=1945593 RepID=UPI00345BA58B
MKLLQERQRQDKQQIEMLVDSIPGGIGTYEIRPDGFHVVYVSKGVPAISGRTTEEYLAYFNVAHKSDIFPADEQMVLEHLRNAIATGADLDLIYRVLHVNGQPVWVDMHGCVMGQRNGYPVFHVVFHNPSKTVELYRSIIDEADSVLAVADCKTKELLFVNKAAQRLTGVPQSQIIGKPCYELLRRRHAPCEGCMADRLGGDPLCGELEIDARRYFTRMTRINWNGHDAFITYLADQTERYAAQNRLSAVLKNIPGGLAAFHVVGDQIIRTYLSEGAVKALGYDEGESFNDDAFANLSRVHPDDRAALTDAVRSAIANRLQCNVDMRMVLKTGETRWINLLANPVEVDGELYFYGIYSDVTEQKRGEEAALAEREKQIAEYQRELRQLSAVQSEDLLAKLSLDLTDGILESSWAKSGAGICYDDVTVYAQVYHRMVASGLTKGQRDTIAEILDRKRLLAAFEKGENNYQFEFQRRNASGRIYWASSTAKTYLDPESGHIKIFLYTHDIDSKRTPALLMERLLSLEIEMLGAIDVQTGVIYHYRNSDIDQLPSQTGGAKYVGSLREFAACFVPEENRSEFFRRMGLACVLEHLPAIDSMYSYSFWITYRGRFRRKSCNFTYLDESKTTVIVMRSDTTDDFLEQEERRNELNAAQAEVERAKLDGVTRIYNRITTETLIAQRLLDPDNGRCAFILLDLDDLKRTNDSFGHLQGDRALQAIAAALKSHFRRTDLFGRIGGDEFVVFLTGIKEDADLQPTLQTLLHELSQARVGERNEHVIHCSIGCALGQCGTDDFKSLYRQADTALYHVKRNGKNDYAFYTPEMQAADYIHAGHTTISLRDELSVNRHQLNQLMDAISSYYPLVVSVNLTQDRYFLMESSAYVIAHISASGTYRDFLSQNAKAIHPEDEEAFSTLSRASLLRAYEAGKPSVQCHARQLDQTGHAYRHLESTVVFYKNDSGDICAFFFARPAEGKQQEVELLRLHKIMELAVKCAFEYICLLHGDTGSYEVYASDGKNTHAVAQSGIVNDAVRQIRDCHILPGQRDAYYANAVLEHVVERMERQSGQYRYRYEMADGVREAEFCWYEPTHKEILMTVRHLSGTLDGETC